VPKDPATGPNEKEDEDEGNDTNIVCAQTEPLKLQSDGREGDAEGEHLITTDTDGTDNNRAEAITVPKRKRGFFEGLSSETRTAIGMYGVIALGVILFDELLPVYAELSASRGGLGLHRNTLGGILTMQGAILLTFQLLVFSRLCNWLGPRSLFLWATGLAVPLFLCFPLLPVAQQSMERAGGGWRVWVGAYFPFLFFKNIFTPSFFSAVFILINSAAKQKDLGRVNGVG